MHYSLVIFGNKSTTRYMIEYIHREICPINLVITVGGDLSNNIAGYSDIRDICQSLEIPIYYVEKYSLQGERDSSFFMNNSFDLGIAIGWQRLIPDTILERFKNGIFGFHGSAGYLPYGRGRSPLNWSLIKGHSRFINHCFKYTSEADEGKIHSLKMFEINEHDTIQTLQHKTLLVSKEQVKSLIDDYQRDSINLAEQSPNISSWYPKRKAEDGKIDLSLETKQIYNLIRGVTNPFPGAFLLDKNERKLLIWEAYPFDQIIDLFKYSIGEVVEIFNRDFILKTIDGSLLIKKYDFDSEISKGDIFH